MRQSSCPQFDASDAVGANLSRTQHQQETPAAQDLAIPIEEYGHRPPEPSLVRGYTYIPMRRGFLYLVAIMDWHSRKVLSLRLSNSMDADFCVEALNEAIAKHGTPEIFNSVQGSQFTSGAWIDVLVDADIKISMVGKGAWRDNWMIERLWRSLKYECVYPNAFETGSEMRAGIGKWLTYYNSERPHSTHGILTPDEAYDSRTVPMKLAA